ncbi:MAG: protoporphyrinogen oxidase [Anaerolineae bacterium]
MTIPYECLIIGGGITGLSAAWYLQEANLTHYCLLEKADRWGGKVISARLPLPNGQSCLADGGPESFVTRKPEVLDLANALGVETSIPASETAGMHLLKAGKIYPVPLHPLIFIKSGLLSLRGKLRLIAEPFIAPRRDWADESIADFVRRRLGQEALDHMLGPILAGIYNADPTEQSIMVSSPIMRQMEREYGSLVRALIVRMRAARKARRQNGTRKPQFVAFRNGAEALINALVEKLRGDLRLNSAVTCISRSADVYTVTLSTGETFSAKRLLLATTANVSAHLLRDLAPQSATLLGLIEHSSIGTASLVFRTSELPTKRKIRGLIIPRREGRAIDAVQWTSDRMNERAPEGYTLLRVFFGGAQPHMVTLDEPSLETEILAELSALFGIQAKPVAFRAFRWEQQYPLARVGHLDLVERIEASLPSGVFVAGSSYRGVGVPDCIKQAKDAVQKVIQAVRGSTIQEALHQ